MVLLTVRYCPPGVTTWTGGSYMHQTTCADAVASLTNESATAIGAAGSVLLSLISVLQGEPVTDPTTGVYEPWLTPSLELLTNARHMHLERVGLRPGVLRPHSLAELGIGHEAAAVAHERRQYPELDARQPERPAAAYGGALAQVEGDVADHQPRAAAAAMPAGDRLHPGHQPRQREGLGAIIVGAPLPGRDA